MADLSVEYSKKVASISKEETERIAKICHEANRAYCEGIGDMSQPSWENAPQWQKDSAVNGVIFHGQNMNAGPSASHDNWLKEKREDGWIYGEVKDPEKKEHPCMVEYNELPLEQRMKDYIFTGIVKAYLNGILFEEIIEE